MVEALDAVEERERGDQFSSALLWIATVNRHFHLGESLRETCRRRWWDLLAFRLVMEAARSG